MGGQRSSSEFLPCVVVEQSDGRYYVEAPVRKPKTDYRGSTTRAWVLAEVLPAPVPGHDAEKVARKIAKMLNRRNACRTK